MGERSLGGAPGRELDDELAQVVDAFGFEAAQLVGPEGQLLAATPAGGQPAGESVASEFAYLRSAVRGQAAVSDVVESSVAGVPVVAFAAPFDTPSGRRVLSGAFAVRDTPLHDYLKGIPSLPDFDAAIIDVRGGVVATVDQTDGSLEVLREQDPAVADALRRGRSITEDGRFVAGNAVAGTSWQLVISVPESTLLAPTRGRNVWQWAGLALIVVTGLFSCWLGLRLHRERRQLLSANAQLETFAHLDGLTGLYSRRRLDQLLVSEHERCRRDGSPLTALIIDVDHFKDVNDTYGHTVGDDVLRSIAERLKNCTREANSIGRWGGEEFLVLLPHTPAGEASAVAERMRRAVSEVGIPVGTPAQILAITVSIGCCSDAGHAPATLINHADHALYAAKKAGRNRALAHEQDSSAQRV